MGIFPWKDVIKWEEMERKDEDDGNENENENENGIEGMINWVEGDEKSSVELTEKWKRRMKRERERVRR